MKWTLVLFLLIITVFKPTPCRAQSDEVDGIYYEQIFKRHLYLSNGNILHGVPEGGAEGFDWKAAAKKLPHNCGVYSYSNGNLRVQWHNGVITNYKKGTDGLRSNGNLYYRMLPPRGEKLSGLYWNANKSGAFRFNSDGSFEERTIKETNNGTYKIDGYTLVLTFRGGRRQKYTMFTYAADRAAQPKVILLDYKSYYGYK